VIAILVAGFLYGVMMFAVYFLGIFFIKLFGGFFSFIAHLSLKFSNNIEYKIQNLFSRIDNWSHMLSEKSDESISLLQEAQKNAWKDNLLTKINDSLENIGTISSKSVDASKNLKTTLEKSKYSTIFNFRKYQNWVKREILEPIENIIALLEANKILLLESIDHIEKEIEKTKDSSLKNPLKLQKKRLEIQIESFERTL
jgi:hypothetical protein